MIQPIDEPRPQEQARRASSSPPTVSFMSARASSCCSEPAIPLVRASAASSAFTALSFSASLTKSIRFAAFGPPAARSRLRSLPCSRVSGRSNMTQ